MKLLFCKMCNDLIVMHHTIRQCECGNVIGNYRKDNFSVELDVTKGNWGSVRVVGIDNRLLTTDCLPKYTKNPESTLAFDAWGSAIIILPPYMISEVYKIDPDRFPVVKFKSESL